MRLSDSVPFKYQIVEGTNNGPLRVRGVFQRADEKNANGRVYPRSIWERILGTKEVLDDIGRRRMVGEVDHPIESEMKLSRASHVITGLSLNENNEVIGEFEVLPTEPGKHLESLLRSGVQCGISSRGEGSTKNENGVEMIQPDYKLQTFDIVATPSTREAYPKVVTESKSSEGKVKEDTMDKFTETRNQAESILRADLSKTTKSQRDGMVAAIPGLIEKFDRIVIEDPGYKSLAEGLNRDLIAKQKVLTSNIAPPVIERQTEAAEDVLENVVQLANARHGRQMAAIQRLRKAVAESKRKNAKLAQENARLRRQTTLMEDAGDTMLEEFREFASKHKELKEKYGRLAKNYKKIKENSKKKVEVKSTPPSTSKRVTKMLSESIRKDLPRRRPALVETKESQSDPVWESMKKTLGPHCK